MQGNSSFQQNTKAFNRPERDLEIELLKKQLEEAKNKLAEANNQNETLKHALEERDLEIQILQSQVLTYRNLDAIIGIANQSNASLQVRLEEARVITMLLEITEKHRILASNTINVINNLKSTAEDIVKGNEFLVVEKHCEKIIANYLVNEINKIANDNFEDKAKILLKTSNLTNIGSTGTALVPKVAPNSWAAQAINSAANTVKAVGATTITIGGKTVTASTVGIAAAVGGTLAGVGIVVYKSRHLEEKIAEGHDAIEKLNITFAELCGYGPAFKDVVEVYYELDCWYQNLLYIIEGIRITTMKNGTREETLLLLKESTAGISNEEEGYFAKADKKEQKFLMPGLQLRGMFLYLMVEEKLFYTESREKYPDGRIKLLYDNAPQEDDTQQEKKPGGLEKKEPTLLIGGSLFSLKNNPVAVKVAQELIISLVTAVKAKIKNSIHIPSAKVENPKVKQTVVIEEINF